MPKKTRKSSVSKFIASGARKRRTYDLSLRAIKLLEDEASRRGEQKVLLIEKMIRAYCKPTPDKKIEA
jgi:hypothetical protein